MKGNNANALIIDDHEGMRYLLQVLVEEEGYNAAAVSDGQQAVELVKKFNFGVVLMDIKYAGDGWVVNVEKDQANLLLLRSSYN